jgi:hypothetical protein
MMDYVEANWGDKPYFASFYTTAGADSTPGTAGDGGGGYSGTFTTQPLRGAAYYTAMQNVLTNIATSTGNHPYIGMGWFQMYDFSTTNWGVATLTDNAYDGREAASGSVSCSAPLAAFTCGSEPTPGISGGVRPFGNLIGGATGVKAANALWLALPASGITGTGSVKGSGVIKNP